MNRTPAAALLLALTIAVAACTSSDSDETTTTTGLEDTTTTAVAETTTTVAETQSQPEEAASAFFSFEEIGIDPDGWVALNNFTDVPVTLAGLHLCQGPDCFALPDESVEPGQTAYIATGEAPDADGVIVTGATIGTLAPSNGEVALYVTDPGDPGNIIAYLQWGSTPHDRTEEAIAAGLTLEGTFAPAGDNAVRLFRDADSGLWLWDAA